MTDEEGTEERVRVVPKKGVIFTHATFRDHSTHRNRRMRVTSVRKDTVYYTYAESTDNKAAWFLDRDVWEERYS